MLARSLQCTYYYIKVWFISIRFMNRSHTKIIDNVIIITDKTTVWRKLFTKQK